MVGGVLVERTVKDVLPALEHNNEQVCKVTLDRLSGSGCWPCSPTVMVRAVVGVRLR